MSHEKQLAFILSMPILALLIIFGLIPLSIPIISQYEGQMFPVIKNAEIESSYDTDQGKLIYVSFDKVRSCEFEGIQWFDYLGNRYSVQFEVNSELLPPSRPVLSGQQAGPWIIVDLNDLTGSNAIVSHRCSPFWLTYTNFYP